MQQSMKIAQTNRTVSDGLRRWEELVDKHYINAKSYIYSEARLGYLIIFIIQRTLQRSEIYIHDFHIRILPHI